MKLSDAIENRRSIRKFSNRYVTDEELYQVIEAATNAPSWKNTQTWEFIILRDREVIQKTTELYSSTNPASQCSMDASAVIVACAKEKVSGFKNEEQRTKFSDWFMFDLGCAVQNLCLKAFELNLGTVIVGSMEHDKIKKTLELPENINPIVAIPIGEIIEKNKKKPTRKSPEEITHLNSYGKKIFKTKGTE